MRSFFLFIAISYILSTQCIAADAVRLKDLGRFSGWRENPLIGYGLVTGLAGTGDSPNNKATRQAIANTLSQFGANLSADAIQSRNSAIVLVSASLQPFSRSGDSLDVTVTSVGDARSLVGGSLLTTPLKAANEKIYALAQGAIMVGGYKYDQNGNVKQKNHPTVGSIPGGATVEVGVTAQMLNNDRLLTFVLTDPDFTTASRIASVINNSFGGSIAQPRDASAIEIGLGDRSELKLVDFVMQIERLKVEPDSRARVVINERTGTVVSGGDVRINKIAISHGDLKISIDVENSVSQPIFVRDTGSEVRTEVFSNSKVEVNEGVGAGYLRHGNGTVADLVQALTRLKLNTRDIISILRAIKAAGALHAELVVQ